MKNIVISIFVVSALFWISGASAGKYPGKSSPESVVTCVGGGGPYFIYTNSISGTVDTEQCQIKSPDHTCSPCVSSLEDQGCEIVDVVVDNVVAGETVLTYLLSCVKP